MSVPPGIRFLAAAGLSGGAHGVLLRRLRGKGAWERQNFRGRTVNLAGGAATAAAALIAATSTPRHLRASTLIAAAAAAGTGMADDLATDPTAAKGLKGHLRALARGEVTTGAAKLLGISGAALVSAGIISRGRTAGRATYAIDALTSGALIAGMANLINLFDLRPGRALKVTALTAAALACDPTHPDGRAVGTLTAGLVAGAAPTDLQERTMLGDVGANSLGALLGVGLASHPDPRVRGAALAAVTTLILASEKVSFSRIIERTPALARLDRWGRAP